jgi:hypothetical protein
MGTVTLAFEKPQRVRYKEELGSEPKNPAPAFIRKTRCGKENTRCTTWIDSKTLRSVNSASTDAVSTDSKGRQAFAG